MSGRAGEQTPLRVDDRPPWPDQVNGAIGLPVGERRVRRTVKDLDRPGTECEQAKCDGDNRCEPADADEEAGAAKERCVRLRVRLKAAAATGEGARELPLAPGIGTGDGYGSGDRWDERLPCQCMDGSGGSLILGELVREEGQPEAAPGEIGVCEERGEPLGDGRQAVDLELGKRCVQGVSAFGRVELAREALGGDGVQVELAMRIAARGEHEHRAPPRGVQVVVGDRHVVEHEPDERNYQLAR